VATSEAWQTAEVPGPTKALVIKKPEVVLAMIKRAKRPLLVVGHEAAETELGEKMVIDYMIELAQKSKIPVVATAHTVREFLNRGFQMAWSMPAVDVGNRLTDSEWCGLDGKGSYDLAMFIGLPYYMGWTILSGLKHFAPNVKTVALDNVYHPQASWSFPNISKKDWKENLEAIVEKIGGA
jgi:acetyl-CoA decarbonylase/synthase complex subunit epsilon